MIILVLLEGGAAGAMAGTMNMWMEDQVTMLKKRFQMNYRGTLGAFPVSEFDAYSLNMDRMMISLECCGVIGNGDFSDTESLWYKEGRKYTDGSGPDDIKIPPACCKYTSKDFMSKGDYNAFQNNLVDQSCVKTLEESNTVGCLVAAKTRMQEKGLPYLAIPSIIVALQLATIVLSIYLVCKLKKWNNELYS
ncbi:unnamed protein product [Schistosoma turkestanicum]|nr:unnamed protein product [Schistosoma turkestanicum]